MAKPLKPIPWRRRQADLSCCSVNDAALTAAREWAREHGCRQHFAGHPQAYAQSFAVVYLGVRDRLARVTVVADSLTVMGRVSVPGAVTDLKEGRTSTGSPRPSTEPPADSPEADKPDRSNP